MISLIFEKRSSVMENLDKYFRCGAIKVNGAKTAMIQVGMMED